MARAKGVLFVFTLLFQTLSWKSMQTTFPVRKPLKIIAPCHDFSFRRTE